MTHLPPRLKNVFGLNIFISFYNYTSIQIYMMIIQAMGLERKLKAYKVLLPEKKKLFSCSTQLNMKILNAHKYENNKNFGFFWLR